MKDLPVDQEVENSVLVTQHHSETKKIHNIRLILCLATKLKVKQLLTQRL